MLIMDEYDVNLGIIRSERNHPPAHYLVKINPYSSFASDWTNVYLVNDCCSFGAEVFVIPKTRKYEFVRSLTPSEENNDKRFTWKLDNFSKNTQSVRSQVFTTLYDDEEIKWSFLVSYVARGSDSIRNYDDDYLSLRLVSEHKDLPLGIHVHAHFTLRVKAQIDSKHIERQGKNWFSTNYEDFGWDHFASMGELQGCISDNTLIVECDINKLTLADKR